MQNAMKLTWIMMIALGLCSCAQGPDDELKSYIATVKKRAASPIKPIPSFKKVANYQFNPSGMRDPFEPFKQQRKQANNGPDKDRKKEPLESFPLDALKIVGMVEQQKQAWALVLAPNGIVYKVTTGNYLGQNYGKIMAINKDAVSLHETVRIANEWTKKKVKLDLMTEQKP